MQFLRQPHTCTAQSTQDRLLLSHLLSIQSAAAHTAQTGKLRDKNPIQHPSSTNLCCSFSPYELRCVEVVSRMRCLLGQNSASHSSSNSCSDLVFSIKLVLQTKYQIPAASTVTAGSAQTGRIGLCLWLSTKASSGEGPNAPIHEVQASGC